MPEFLTPVSLSSASAWGASMEFAWDRLPTPEIAAVAVATAVG